MREASGRKYLYQKSYMAFLQGVIDSIGYRLFKQHECAFDASKVRKILVSRIDHLGDVFIASSALPHLRKAYPTARIHFMAGTWTHPYLKLNPLVDEILAFDGLRFNRGNGILKRLAIGIASYVRALRKLRSERYDLFLALRAYPFNSIPLAYLGGARCIVGFGAGGYGFLLDKTAPYREGTHEVGHVADVLRAISLSVSEKEMRPGVTVSDEARSAFEKELVSLGVEQGERYALIHTGSGSNYKLWDKEQWQRLVDALKCEFGLKVIGSDPVYKGLNGCINAPSLIELEGFAVAAQGASLFVGLDSFPAHLAASFGTPTVVVWCGINDHRQWRPVGSRVAVVRKDVDCAPCFKKTGCPDMKERCMDISADDCLKEIRGLLAGR
ncbi:MAG: glycosyltransferase family 9 protein [Deltaproteobacteria bacterium]|nr:glycosyltransferase family 9 protein [Deltaproteobacteria bacterium]